jgi:hypothetical protein
MELVEATGGDIDALVDRWQALARSMESHDPLNELADGDVDDVSEEGFRAHPETTRSRTTSSSTRARRSASSRSGRGTTHPGGTPTTSAS